MSAWLRIGSALARRPSLWSTSARLAVRMAPNGWWRRAPFLPLPSRDYLEFRMVTQYGPNGAAPEAGDVLNYVAWCRRQRT